MRHLLLVTVEDPYSPKSWSGTPYNMLKSLEKRFERVSVLSSQVPKRNLLGAALRFIFGRKKYPLWMTRAALKAYANRLNDAVEKLRPDIVLCISSQHLIYAKELDLPVFMISDAPWMAYKEAYRKYEALPLLSRQYARQEAAVARRISGVIYPTPWACKEAEIRFGIAGDKVQRIPFGANTFCPSTDVQVLRSVRLRTLDRLNFLFVGKDWERKGGPLALALVKCLNERGFSAQLHVVGCRPEIDADALRHVRLHGYLSPGKADDSAKLLDAFARADFFLVPSHAECFGLVFAEAQSYGLPCISLDSHGIPGVVEDGKTGLLFDSSTPVEQIADEVTRLIKDRPAYVAMALAARLKFTQELNWDSFGARVRDFAAQRQ